tara:strand:+ start:9654 stop:9869 length:216 start_codon:yes stop_codon:yes gene_type:complete
MKALFLNIKNITPYLLLIAIYFLFINIEARNSRNIYKNTNTTIKENESNNDDLYINYLNRRIEIPVIPYVE